MLKRKFLFSFLAICSAAAAQPDNFAEDSDDPFAEGIAMRRVYYENHNYICFNNKFFVHDPDCGCTDRYVGYLEKRDHDAWIVHLYRRKPSDYD